MMLRYLPNFFTVARLILIVPFLYCLYTSQYATSFYIFIFAGFTDGLDGWLARQFHWQSSFGSFVDPMADKLLIASSFISLAYLKYLPYWLVALVFLRDMTISFGVLAWYGFIQQKPHFKPSLLSKLNTVLQLALVTFCLFELAFKHKVTSETSVLIVLTTITTTATYIDYVFRWGKKAYSGVTQTP